MRIDAYNQVAAIYKSSKPARTNAAKKTGSFQDQLQISQTGRDYQIAKQAVANASDIREDKVAELKTKVDSGNYKVDAGDFASKLLEKYNELY
ncbi:flagellar biosynthesis anti-sigma factor FlgM [Lachnospiraceae bacterium 47-T17]